MHLKNRTDLRMKREVVARIPTKEGVFQLALYSDNKENKENLAIIYGGIDEIAKANDVYVRVHSECFTGEVLGSLRCDCGEQLSTAMYNIAQRGLGVVVFLRQEGRGIGLQEKLKAYNLQDQGHDTVEANLMLGHKADARSFEPGALILEDLGIKRIRLLTNNPLKIESLRYYGIDILDRIPMLPKQISVDTLNYLKTKVDRMRHGIQLDQLAINTTPIRPESCPVSPTNALSPPTAEITIQVPLNGHQGYHTSAAADAELTSNGTTDINHITSSTDAGTDFVKHSSSEKRQLFQNEVDKLNHFLSSTSLGMPVGGRPKMWHSASSENVSSMAMALAGNLPVPRSSVPCIVSDDLPTEQTQVNAYTVWGRPYVTLTYAQSLNGCIATRERSPLAISCDESLVMTHQLRADHDGILVGIGTVCADNPRLTVRLANGNDPLPIILDTNLRVPMDVTILDNKRKPWIVCRIGCDESKIEALGARGVTVVPIDCEEGEMLDVSMVLGVLKQRGIKSLMVEGGASIITSFLASRLVDFVVVTISPVFINGLELVPSSSKVTLPSLESPVSHQLGTDAIISGRPVWQ